MAELSFDSQIILGDLDSEIWDLEFGTCDLKHYLTTNNQPIPNIMNILNFNSRI